MGISHGSKLSEVFSGNDPAEQESGLDDASQNINRNTLSEYFDEPEIEELTSLYESFSVDGTNIDLGAFSSFIGIPMLPWLPISFARVFSYPELPEPSIEKNDSQIMLTIQGFTKGISRACREKRTTALRMLFDICCISENDVIEREMYMDRSKLQKMFILIYVMGLAAWNRPVELSDFDSEKMANSALSGIQAFGNGTGNQTLESFSFDHFVEWATERAPLLHHCLGTFLQRRCFPKQKARTNIMNFKYPNLLQTSSIFSGLKAELVGLCISASQLQDDWVRLYTSDEDGLSFNRICYNIMGYAGPTLLVIRDRITGAVFGGLATDTWKEAVGFYGNPYCLLMQLSPEFRICRSKLNSEGNFMYLNLKGYSQRHGLGMGGTNESFRLFISDNMEVESNSNRHRCTTYESGCIVPPRTEQVDVDCIEVWGVGGKEIISNGLEARQEYTAKVAHIIQKARKVDKAKFAGNEFDREFLLGKTFNGGSHESARQGNA